MRPLSHCPYARDPFCIHSRGWTQVGAYEYHLACLMFCWTVFYLYKI